MADQLTVGISSSEGFKPLPDLVFPDTDQGLKDAQAAAAEHVGAQIVRAPKSKVVATDPDAVPVDTPDSQKSDAAKAATESSEKSGGTSQPEKPATAGATTTTSTSTATKPAGKKR